MLSNTIPRYQYSLALAQRFIKEYDDLLKDYSHELQLVITEHLLDILELIDEYVATDNDEYYKTYQISEDKFLKKYGSQLKSYAAKAFYRYFQFDLVLVEKDIITSEAFNAMTGEEQTLTLNDKKQFLSTCKNVLYQQKHYLYLESGGQNDSSVTLNDNSPVTLNDNFIVTDEPDKEITKARQLLAIYYFLKASLGIEARGSSSVSGVARFIHLLTGTKFTTVQNSDIYKKFLRMPNYKEKGPLIDDLKFIRSYFEELEIGSVVKLIDEEIKRAISEVAAGDRKKYRDNE